MLNHQDIPAYYKLWIMTPMGGWYRQLVEAIENLVSMEGFWASNEQKMNLNSNMQWPGVSGSTHLCCIPHMQGIGSEHTSVCTVHCTHPHTIQCSGCFLSSVSRPLSDMYCGILAVHAKVWLLLETWPIYLWKTTVSIFFYNHFLVCKYQSSVFLGWTEFECLI